MFHIRTISNFFQIRRLLSLPSVSVFIENADTVLFVLLCSSFTDDSRALSKTLMNNDKMSVEAVVSKWVSRGNRSEIGSILKVVSNFCFGALSL